jgi:hypothetical protein
VFYSDAMGWVKVFPAIHHINILTFVLVHLYILGLSISPPSMTLFGSSSQCTGLYVTFSNIL